MTRQEIIDKLAELSTDLNNIKVDSTDDDFFMKFHIDMKIIKRGIAPLKPKPIRG